MSAVVWNFNPYVNVICKLVCFQLSLSAFVFIHWCGFVLISRPANERHWVFFVLLWEHSLKQHEYEYEHLPLSLSTWIIDGPLMGISLSSVTALLHPYLSCLIGGEKTKKQQQLLTFLKVNVYNRKLWTVHRLSSNQEVMGSAPFTDITISNHAPFLWLRFLKTTGYSSVRTLGCVIYPPQGNVFAAVFGSEDILWISWVKCPLHSLISLYEYKNYSHSL